MATDPSLAAELRDILFRLRSLETGIPLQNASVSTGRLRFIGGLLKIDSGGRLEVVGSASIDGSTTVNGTFVLTGSGWRIVGSGTIEGPTTVTGTLQVDGDTRITGNLSLEGDISLSGTLDVDFSGRILIGDNMTLDPSSNGGSVKFAGGPEVYASGGELGLYSTGGGAYVTLNGAAGELHGPGLAKVSVAANDFQFVGLRTMPLSEAPAGAFVGACVWDASNRPRRVVAG